MNLKSSPGVYHYHSFTQEQMILITNLKSSPDVYDYQWFTQEQMILLMNLKSSSGVCQYQLFTQEQMILSMNLKSWLLTLWGQEIAAFGEVNTLHTTLHIMYIIINNSHWSRWFCQWIWNNHQVYIIINHLHRSRWFYQWI